MSKAHFTPNELKAFRKQLSSLAARLDTNLLSLRNEALRPVGAESVSEQGSPEAQGSDLGSRDAEEMRAIAVLDSEEHLLAEATAALARLDGGTFGQCDDCGKHIPRARLKALPYARRCVRCESAQGG
jgi:DnaK suppressor protein